MLRGVRCTAAACLLVALAASGCGEHIGYSFTGRSDRTYPMRDLVAGRYGIGYHVDPGCSRGIDMVLRQTDGGSAVVPVVSRYTGGPATELLQLPGAGTYQLEVTDPGGCRWFFGLEWGRQTTP